MTEIGITAPLYRVFLSHSSNDRDFVDAMRSQVAAMGVSAYMHEHDCQAGAVLADKLQHEIDGSDAVIVLLTDNSRGSTYVHQEIGYARARGKLIIPLVDPAVASETLGMLQGVEWIPFDLGQPHSAMALLTTRLGALQDQRLAAIQDAQARRAQQGLMIAVGLVVVVLLVVALSSRGTA